MKLRSLLYALCMACGGFSLMGLPVLADEEPAAELSDSNEEKPRKKKGKKKRASKKGKESKEKDAAGTPAVSAVVAALEKFKVHNAKVNKKADFYIYLYSASTCGHCQTCMPIAVEQYKKMRASRKVELIVIGGDGSEQAAIKYLKSYKLKCPGIMFDALKATQFQGLPGCGFPGLPAVSVVDKDGQMIKNVIGGSQVREVLTNWKQYTIGK